jgi:SSS family solute:Na+ symporter
MLDIIIVFGYLFVALVLGVWASKGASFEDYRTGGRQYPAWIIFVSISASFIGGGFTLGLADKTFLYGVIYIIAICGFSLKEILIALVIAPRMQSFRAVITVGDIMEQAFGKRAKVITGIASVLVCGGIIGAQVSACGSLIHTFLGPPPAVGALLAASIVIIYSTLGGMKSVVTVDILHFSVFALILPLVLVFGIYEIGGPTTFFQSLPQTHVSIPGTIEIKTFVILFISFFLGETLIPPYIQRLLIGKTIRDTKLGTLSSGVFSIFFFCMIGLIGMVALILAPDLPSTFALPYVIQTVMPIGLKGLAIAAMLAVIMSSVDSFLNSIAIACSHDILAPLNMIRKNKNQELIITRLVTVMIGAGAVIISLTLSSSIDILLYSYQFWTPFILTPFIAAIFGIKSNYRAFVISTITGTTGVALWNFISHTYANNRIDSTLDGTIFGVVLNSLTFIIYHHYFNKRAALPSHS